MQRISQATGGLNGRAEDITYSDDQALVRLARELEIAANARISPDLRGQLHAFATILGQQQAARRIEQQQVRRARMEGRELAAADLTSVKGQGRTTPPRPPLLSVVQDHTPTPCVDDALFGALAEFVARWSAEPVSDASRRMLAAFDRAAARHLGSTPRLLRPLLPGASTPPAAP